MVDRIQATKAAVVAGVQALVQRVPGVNEIVESVNAYKNSIELIYKEV